MKFKMEDALHRLREILCDYSDEEILQYLDFVGESELDEIADDVTFENFSDWRMW